MKENVVDILTLIDCYIHRNRFTTIYDSNQYTFFYVIGLYDKLNDKNTY